MVSSQRISHATELLTLAAEVGAAEPDGRLTKHLLVGAALREVLREPPIVVGGTAEDFYTADEYHETDLDVVAWSLSDDEKRVLVDLGFEPPRGRHWYHEPSGVAVEMPEGMLHGDRTRVRDEPVAGGGKVLIIGPEDLYLDRIRQATSDLSNETFQRSALAIAVSRYETMDWAYVGSVLRRPNEPQQMIRIDSRVRRRARTILAGAR